MREELKCHIIYMNENKSSMKNDWWWGLIVVIVLMDMLNKPTKIHLNAFSLPRNLRNQKIVNRIEKKSYNKIHQIRREKIKILKGFSFELKS